MILHSPAMMSRGQSEPEPNPSLFAAIYRVGKALDLTHTDAQPLSEHTRRLGKQTLPCLAIQQGRR
ncbi:MAG: hypothetical protein RL571_2578 [Pseudomonadota bacterium]|jgi:hypothetical protein